MSLHFADKRAGKNKAEGERTLRRAAGEHVEDPKPHPHKTPGYMKDDGTFVGANTRIIDELQGLPGWLIGSHTQVKFPPGLEGAWQHRADQAIWYTARREAEEGAADERVAIQESKDEEIECRTKPFRRSLVELRRMSNSISPTSVGRGTGGIAGVPSVDLRNALYQAPPYPPGLHQNLRIAASKHPRPRVLGLLGAQSEDDVRTKRKLVLFNFGTHFSLAREPSDMIKNHAAPLLGYDSLKDVIVLDETGDADHCFTKHSKSGAKGEGVLDDLDQTRKLVMLQKEAQQEWREKRDNDDGSQAHAFETDWDREQATKRRMRRMGEADADDGGCGADGFRSVDDSGLGIPPSGLGDLRKRVFVQENGMLFLSKTYPEDGFFGFLTEAKEVWDHSEMKHSVQPDIAVCSSPAILCTIFID